MVPNEKHTKPYAALGAILSKAIGRQGKSQSWVAELCDVSQAAVSQWLSGDKKPTTSHLADLARWFSLDPDELAKAAGYDSQRVIKLCTNRSVSFLDLEHFRLDVKHIYAARVSGDPQLTIEMANDVDYLIRGKKKELVGSSFYSEVQTIHARVLSEKAIAIREICSSDEVLNYVAPIALEIQRIGELHGDDNIFTLGSSCLTDAHYIHKSRRDAIKHARYALTLSTDLDNRLLLIRTLLMCLALSNDKDEFEHVSRNAMKLVHEGQYLHAEVVCTLLEGMSTGQGILGIKDTFDSLEQARIFHRLAQEENAHLPAFRYIQLGRSGLQSAQYLQTKDTNEFEKYALEALNIARERGYQRYIDQLLALINHLS
jgi:transcriptional regulator with XRE-family HTH domain